MVFSTGPLTTPTGIRPGSTPLAGGFLGNPNPSVTSVDTSGGIVLSRSSGTLPAFVQASASAILASGSSFLSAYEDLEYSWNFGDTGTPKTMPHPITGATMNANTDQQGPEAVYYYDTVGTFTITLTIRWKNAGNTFQTQTNTSFSASAFVPNAEYWIDPVNGNDGNPGTSPASPWQTFTNLHPLDFNGKRFNLKRGTTIDDHLSRQQSRISVRFQSYGNPSDPNPIINYTGGGNSGHIIWVDTGGGSFFFPTADWVTQDIDWLPGGTTNDGFFLSGAVHNANCYMQDIYFLNCKFYANPGRTQNIVTCNNFSDANMDNRRVGFWNCQSLGDTNALDGAQRQGLAIQGWNEWLFVMGGFHEGNGQDNIRDHHIYPIIQKHALFRWINFGTGLHKSHCINTDWNNNAVSNSCTAGTIDNGAGNGLVAGSVFTPAGTITGSFSVGQNLFFSGGGANGYYIAASLGGGQYTIKDIDTGNNVSFALTPQTITSVDRQYSEFILYEGCKFNGVRYAFDADDANNNYAIVQWRNNICQNCDFTNLSDGGPLGFSFSSLTLRDSRIYSMSGVFWNFGSMGYVLLDNLSFKVYRNKGYLTADWMYISTNGGIPITSALPLQWTDNEIQFVGNGVILLAKASDLGANSIIDRNKYYAPSDSDGKIFLQNGTAESLATWKGHGPNFDPTSTDTQPPFPAWIDPANGNFNT